MKSTDHSLPLSPVPYRNFKKHLAFCQKRVIMKLPQHEKEFTVIMVSVNVKLVKRCAFCKYWYDPCNTHIKPQFRDIWYFDNTAKCKCLKKNIQMAAFSFCNEYVCKL